MLEKRRAAQTVAPHTTADGDDQIVWLHFAGMCAVRQNAETAAIDERVGRVAVVVDDGAVDGRMPILLPQSRYRGRRRRQCASGAGRRGAIGRVVNRVTETEDVGVG